MIAGASRDGPSGGHRVVIVICDSLRRDLIDPALTPFLAELAQRAARFAAHRSVFPSTTRASAASIATGCHPARHGLQEIDRVVREGAASGGIPRVVGHRCAASASRAASGMTSSSPSNWTSPVATRSARMRFTDCLEPPIMAASSDCV